jgi:hypothetical protein
MNDKFQIEKINYDLITQAINLSYFQKNILMGNINKFVAARFVGNGYEILMQTIGKRDESLASLERFLNLNQVAA